MPLKSEIFAIILWFIGIERMGMWKDNFVNQLRLNLYNAYFPIYHLTINDKQSRRRKSRTRKRRRLSLGCYSTLFEDAIGNIENIDNSLLQRPQSSPKRKLKGEAIKDLMSSLNSSTSSLSSTAEQPRDGKNPQKRYFGPKKRWF